MEKVYIKPEISAGTERSPMNGAAQKSKTKTEGSVTAVICCYNEAERIGKVLDVLTSHDRISRVVVVNDGNQDDSAEVISRYDVSLIQNEKRVGKGEAVKQAVSQVRTDLVLMCDADLVGLRKSHVTSLIEPAAESPNVMSIASLDKYWHMGRDSLKNNLMLIPINGTRVLRTDHLKEACEHHLFSGWKAETVINHVVRGKGVRIRRVNLKGVKDVVKTRKKNHGMRHQFVEIGEVLEVNAKLLPRTMLNFASRAAASGKKKIEAITR